MSKQLKGCCRRDIAEMINKLLGSAQVFLLASPFILILPDLIGLVQHLKRLKR